MSEGTGKALRYAFKLLGYRGRSESELSERLRLKGFSDDEVRAALERLKDGGYVDDGALARSLRTRAEEVKLLGSYGARMYLRRMGIPREVAEEALEGYDEALSAKRLVQSRQRAVRGLPASVARRRLAGCLSRRGYSAETVRKALDSYGRERQPGPETERRFPDDAR